VTTATLNCCTWNVNGFRSALGKGFMDWLEQADPDLLSLQEIRAQWDEVDLGVRRALESAFDICWYPCVSKKGYAGSATLSKRELGFSHTRGLGIEAYDQEGRIIISTRGDLAFIGGYFPNASAGLVRLPFKRQFARDLAAVIRARHALGQSVILTGDMNVAPEPIDRPGPTTTAPAPASPTRSVRISAPTWPKAWWTSCASAIPGCRGCTPGGPPGAAPGARTWAGGSTISW